VFHVSLSFFQLLKLAVAAFAFISHAAFAVPVNFSGELTASDLTFNRPSSLSKLGAIGTNVSYDVSGFHVSAGGTYSIRTTAATFDNGNPYDTYLFLYANAFDASAPLTNLIALDDDSGNGFLSLITRSLEADVQYFLVISSYAYDQFGSYAGTFDTVSAGQVVLDGASEVPEPATLTLLPLAMLGMALARRRQRG
jgi:hypothetical protein